MACWLTRAFPGIPEGAPEGAPALDPAYGVGAWIWTADTKANQTCRLWKTFQLPPATPVKLARLHIIADDNYRLFLNGTLVGSGGPWRKLNEYEVAPFLKPGPQTLAVEAYNSVSVAGVALGLHVELANGTSVAVASDASWRVVPDDVALWTEPSREAQAWPPATVIAAFGRHPWFETPGTYGAGSWIWTAETREQQTCRFWRAFRLPDCPVERAQLRVSADNSYRLFFDGRELGRGAEWRALTDYDVKSLLTPGEHILAVEAFNDNGRAGMTFGLNVLLANGVVVEVVSDASWRIASLRDKHWAARTRAAPGWPPATIVAAFEDYPWQNMPWIVYAQPPPPIVLRFWQSPWFQLPLLFTCLVVALACLHLLGRLAIQARAQQIVARERARIARDIHDDLNSRLTELVLLGELSRRELPMDAPTGARFDQMCESARGLLRTMNEIIWVVNSQRDTVQDFASYVCSYAQNFLKATPIRCRFDLDEDLRPVPCGLDVRRNLFLAVKEALRNAVQHSEATELFLRIHQNGQELRVAVEDNGHGFDPATLKRAGNGLANMRWRAAETGGTCLITSRPGAGCRVAFTVPLKAPSRLPLPAPEPRTLTAPQRPTTPS